MSLLGSQIHCLRPITGIFHPDLIYNAIVKDLNFTVSSILLLATFSLYSKLSHVPISRLLEARSLINTTLDVVILLSFLMRMLYKIEMRR